MNTQFKLLITILCIILPIVLSIYTFFNSEILVPNGYELSIDGYIISRTLVLIFILHSLSKFGYFIYKDYNKND